MLSYRHAFHAGNHADVLKHYVLSVVLDYFNQKEKPYWVVDTHAGAGMYALNHAFSSKNAEYQTGIARLLNAENLTPSLSQFTQYIQLFNKETALDAYPGSPTISADMLRSQDKLRLFELHPTDFEILQNLFAKQQRQIIVEQQDGFQGIKACLPPPTKRGLVLIDPPYELKEDYERVVNCIKDSLKRFATGTYLIWYPHLQRPEPELMISQLKQINSADWLNVSLNLEAPHADGYGMHGSGMFIINPPWKLPEILQSSMPILKQALALDDRASFIIESHIT